MTDARLVSCIVPVFNGERYLEETLTSILAQTHRQLELIVVDDGSTDGTPMVVRRQGDRARYVRQANAGPVAARNRGVQLATGRFIAFLDGDDRWHTEKLDRQLASFEANPDLALCLTHMQNFVSPEVAHGAARGARLDRPVPGYSSCALLARRETFDRVGLFDTAWKHASETDWFDRCAELRLPLVVLPDVLVFRRLHRGNRSAINRSASKEEYLRLLKTRLDCRRGVAAGRHAAE